MKTPAKTAGRATGPKQKKAATPKPATPAKPKTKLLPPRYPTISPPPVSTAEDAQKALAAIDREHIWGVIDSNLHHLVKMWDDLATREDVDSLLLELEGIRELAFVAAIAKDARYGILNRPIRDRHAE